MEAYFIDVSTIKWLEPKWFWGIFLSFTGLALIALYRSIAALKHARSLVDAPTQRIRSAAQGYTSLQGLSFFLDGIPIISPISKDPCVWFYYKVEVLEHKRWRTLEENKSIMPFGIRDNTGTCIVHPKGAKVTTPKCKKWRAFRRNRSKAPASFWGLFATLFGRYRFTEWQLTPDIYVHTLGQFRTSDQYNPKGVDIEVETNKVLSDWKKNYVQLLQKYDTNQDGKLDTQEWEMVIDDAKRNAQSKFQLDKSTPSTHHIDGLGLSSRRPYIISGYTPWLAARKYYVELGMYFVAYLITASFTMWFAAARFGV